MSTKKAKIVANGTGLELPSVPGESILYQLTSDETGGVLNYVIVLVHLTQVRRWIRMSGCAGYSDLVGSGFVACQEQC